MDIHRLIASCRRPEPRQSPQEFGTLLARRHLAMIERAVQKWAKQQPTRADAEKSRFASDRFEPPFTSGN